MQFTDIPKNRPVLIAGPTASGKSALALEIAERDGGVIINADASQVYRCWRILTARPSEEEEERAPHMLYGHVQCTDSYSAGHWLREVLPLLAGPRRPIIVGGTGLYFSALTQGIADIPPTPAGIRAQADAMSHDALISAVDERTLAGLDTRNRARVQRAYEVQATTGRALADWKADTPPPALPLKDVVPLVFDAPRDWLNQRIARRFDQMLDNGALDEVRAMLDRYDPSLPACRAIGVPELVAHLQGELSLEDARERATIATRQFAKRQRTWFRARMQGWTPVHPDI
ncbi:tRNA (adenosine(37)-N6)-dimethylallyltransferase MiaA [Sedimentitalea todarodis]|uniref:tRNA dimethylallyltransferase n=1 Tax=Sedimentitalea todarodis TaxID=1631240 RepID=A0ABU3VC93_9RHOB|nr:tRNA (adenosine(37)-N6)-dimethylallyltransferase MiaA [Sedimentitalea todarodis]MDU9003359.1 tRNA (adenosine(37)-N6)-dimethylallyltransferase MiaA [Sedimentitalea todarodis]